MILRKLPCILAGVLTLCALSINADDAEKYDSNEWIPIAKPCSDCKEDGEDTVPVIQKKATGRVLNLADPPVANFFPEENKPIRNNYQQFLRETSNPFQNQNRQPVRHKQNPHPYRFDSPPPPAVHSGRPQRPQMQKPEPTQQHFFVQPQKQEFTNQQQFAQPQQVPQFFATPQEYHTIPEEYLAQQGLVQQGQFSGFPQNYQTLPNIPDLPPIRLNASAAAIQAINHELQEKHKPVKHIDITSTTPKQEKENVQLLYVPLEALNQNQPRPDLPRIHAYQQAPTPEIHQQFSSLPSIHQQHPKFEAIENDFIKQALEAHKLQQQFQENHQPYALPIIDTTTPSPSTTTTTTTRKPTTKKRKPHQPPLAVYMGGDQNADISDVLTILKDAKSIDVQDSVGPDSPKIFVGPSTLDAPSGYAKFELPYLSSIENNRVERKVEQLPFFVAPLSYRAPPGYSKIPLPSPHVGSVVISTKKKDDGVLSKQVYTQQNNIRVQGRPLIEEYTTRPIPPTTIKYSKPIPDGHVINQYELDQINSFIPQYQQQQQVQQAPEKYSFEAFPQQFPQEYQQYLERDQQYKAHAQQAQQQQQQQQQIKFENDYDTRYQSKPVQPTQQYKPLTEKPISKLPSKLSSLQDPQSYAQKPSPQAHAQYSSQFSGETKLKEKDESVEEAKPFHPSKPLTSQEQFIEEVRPDDKHSFDSIQQTRNTHSNIRLSTTATPHQQYLKEIVSKDNYNYEDVHQTKPTYIRTRPSTTAAPREHYYSDSNEESYNTPAHTRPTHRRTRPTTTAIPSEQYLKETISEVRPSHTRHRQTTTAPVRHQHNQYEHEITNTKYLVNTQSEARPSNSPTRASTPLPHDHFVDIDEVKSDITLFSPRPTHVTVSSTPKEHLSEQNLYLPRPTQNTYPDFDTKDHTKHSVDISNPSKRPYTEFSESYEKSVDTTPQQRYVSKQYTTETNEDEKYNLNQKPVYNPTQLPSHQNQHILNQRVLDSKILGQPQQDSANYIQDLRGHHQNNLKHEGREDEPIVHRNTQQYYTHEDSNDSHEIKTQNANVDIYNLPQEVSPTHQVLPSLINNLEDQSVRQLLHPGIVPAPSRLSEGNHYGSAEIRSTYAPTTTSTTTTTTSTPPPTSTYPSTHYPVVETTTKRTRGRQRGNRYSSTTPSSVYSTRRTSQQRGRRPLPPRTKYQDNESTTDYPIRSTTDPTKRIVTARSRFRTRGRPVQSDAPIADRVSTTERHYYDDVTQTHDHSTRVPTTRIIENEQSTPRLQLIDDQYLGTGYQTYNRPTELSHAPLSPKVVNVEITRPANEPLIVQQINHLPVRNIEEHYETTTTYKPSRGRPRIRTRPKITTTTSPTRITTSRKQESYSEKTSDSEEFYGFFREPSFNKAQSPPATEIPQRSIYSSTYVSSTLRPGVQYAEEPYVQTSSLRYQSEVDENPSTAVHFVGEIRPKYQASSTSEYFEVTEPNPVVEIQYQSKPQETVNDKVKIRGRIRVPGRRVTTEESVERHSNRNYNDLSSKEETSVHTPPRIRTRGKTQYKPKTKPKDSSEDEDVEGGNYPPQFRVGQSQPTSRPSFQITIDPSFDDQEPYPSIYRPTYVAKESSNKDSAQNDQGQTYQSINDIRQEHKGVSDETRTLNTKTDELEGTPTETSNNTNNNVLDQLVEELSDFENIEKKTESIDYIETTTLPDTNTLNGKRRGIWKLVKRPVDVLEGAESQNIGNVNMNSFDSFEKNISEGKTHIQTSKEKIEIDDLTTIRPIEEAVTTPSSTTTEESIFNSLYEMFGITGNEAVLNDEPVATTEPSNEEVSTIPVEETTYIDEHRSAQDYESDQTTHQNDENHTNEDYYNQSPLTTQTTMTYVTPMSLETWNLGILKTSTSTEISHETEICYKGRCIKSKDMKVPMT